MQPRTTRLTLDQPTNDQIDAVLDALLKTGLETEPACTQNGVNIQAFARWLTTENAAAVVSSLTRVAQLRAQLIAAESTIKALRALDAVVTSEIEDSRHAETIRRAAASILRITQFFHRNAPSASPALAQAQPPALTTSRIDASQGAVSPRSLCPDPDRPAPSLHDAPRRDAVPIPVRQCLQAPIMGDALHAQPPAARISAAAGLAHTHPDRTASWPRGPGDRPDLLGP